MRFHRLRLDRQWQIVVPLLVTAALVIPAHAQTQDQPTPEAAAPAKKPPAKPKPKPAAKPATKPKPAAPAEAAPEKPADKPAAAPNIGGVKPTLLGQYGEWGAYTASPGSKKICFVIAKPTTAETNPPNRPRNPVYMFVSTRPADKVTNEVSVITGYPFKSGTEASVTVGTTAYALYTQQDGAWIKNATEEAQLVDAMKGGQSAVVKGTSAKGTQSSDTYSLKGLSQALDRAAQECK